MLRFVCIVQGFINVFHGIMKLGIHGGISLQCVEGLYLAHIAKQIAATVQAAVMSHGLHHCDVMDLDVGHHEAWTVAGCMLLKPCAVMQVYF